MKAVFCMSADWQQQVNNLWLTNKKNMSLDEVNWGNTTFNGRIDKIRETDRQKITQQKNKYHL
jgi:hypothetical protein